MISLSISYELPSYTTLAWWSCSNLLAIERMTLNVDTLNSKVAISLINASISLSTSDWIGGRAPPSSSTLSRLSRDIYWGTIIWWNSGSSSIGPRLDKKFERNSSKRGVAKSLSHFSMKRLKVYMSAQFGSLAFSCWPGSGRSGEI